MTTKRVPKKPEEKKVWIQYQLKLNRSSFAHVARRLGISRQAVRKSLESPTEHIADAISKDIGVPKKKLWPERYAA